MKQTTKNFFRLFPTYLLSFLLCAAAFIAGYFTKGNFTTAWIAVFAASLFIIAFLTITGKIYGFYHAKKVGSEDPPFLSVYYFKSFPQNLHSIASG